MQLESPVQSEYGAVSKDGAFMALRVQAKFLNQNQNYPLSISNVQAISK